MRGPICHVCLVGHEVRRCKRPSALHELESCSGDVALPLWTLLSSPAQPAARQRARTFWSPLTRPARSRQPPYLRPRGKSRSFLGSQRAGSCKESWGRGSTLAWDHALTQRRGSLDRRAERCGARSMVPDHHAHLQLKERLSSYEAFCCPLGRPALASQEELTK